MKLNVVLKYQCQFCGKDFDDRTECFDHEIKDELHIDDNIYTAWYNLQKKVENASYNLYEKHNETTLKAFDEAVERLEKFKEKHNIKNVNIGAYQKFIVYDSEGNEINEN